MVAGASDGIVFIIDLFSPAYEAVRLSQGSSVTNLKCLPDGGGFAIT